MSIAYLDFQSRSAQLRAKLSSLIPNQLAVPGSGVDKDLVLADVIITHNEINEKHGVGVLTLKIFTERSKFIAIRSQNHFNGEHKFGRFGLCLSHAERSRPQVYASVLQALEGYTVDRLVCIPYYPDDVRSAIAIKDIFDTPLCTYIMDDQNICCSDGIPNALLSELLAKSSLRLAISPELRAAYENKFGLKFWLLPPVVSAGLIQCEVDPAQNPEGQSPRGMIIGNIWGARWLELLRKTVRESGVQLEWYCDGGLRWHNCTESDLVKDGILVHAFPQTAALVPFLRRSPFVVLPSGTLDETDDRRAIAQLSLPGKVPFVLATSNTPIIVLGSSETAAAKFIRRFRIGTSAAYTTEDFLKAVEYVTSPEVQLNLRRNAAAMARSFSAQGIQEWIWESLQLGRPCDQRFEQLFSDAV